MVTQIELIDSDIIANNCFSKFDWTLFYISKLIGTVQAILLGHYLTPSLDSSTDY